jgi:hypothetical protein
MVTERIYVAKGCGNAADAKQLHETMNTFLVIIVKANLQLAGVYRYNKLKLTPKTTKSVSRERKYDWVRTIVASGTFVCGWRLCDLFIEGNLIGSLMKKTG